MPPGLFGSTTIDCSACMEKANTRGTTGATGVVPTGNQATYSAAEPCVNGLVSAPLLGRLHHHYCGIFRPNGRLTRRARISPQQKSSPLRIGESTTVIDARLVLFLRHLFPPPTLGECRLCGLARRLIVVSRRPVLMMSEGERPHPWRSHRRRVHLQNAADRNAFSKHVIV